MIRIGILGAARIAPIALIRPASLLPGIEVTAVAASRIEKAVAFGTEHHIETVASNYAELIDSPDIDVVYNALPPNLHEQWSVAALKSGKHVLCEKPFAMNAAQAARMVAAADASEMLLIEAFHYRFHPYFIRVLELLSNDSVGSIRHMTAQFDARIPYSPAEFRHDPELGGGALMDLGCYPAHWVRTLAGSEPQVVQASCEESSKGVDVATWASLRFAGGATAEVITSMGADARTQHYAHVKIEGEKGQLILENPIAPHNGNKIVIESGGKSRTERISGESTYFYQLQHMADVLDGREKPLTGGEDAINNMQLIDGIYKAAGFKRPEIS